LNLVLRGYHYVMKFPPVAWDFLRKVFVRRSVAKIGVEFLTEVGVLVLVFPMLDTIIENGKKITRSLVATSVAIAVMCFIIAAILSMLAGED